MFKFPARHCPQRLIKDRSYLLMQIPSNLFLNKIGKPAIYLPTCMIIWGMISAATAACKNAAGLLAVRFFLGFVEAAYLYVTLPLKQAFERSTNCLLAPDVSTTCRAGTVGASWVSGPLSCTRAPSFRARFPA